MAHGTWKTTGGSGGVGIIAAIVGGALVLGAAGGAVAGIEEGIAESVHALLTILAGLVVIIAAAACLLVWRLRRSGVPVPGTQAAREAFERQADALRDSQRRAIEAPQRPTVNNFYGGQHWHATTDAVRQAISGEAGDATTET